MHDSTNILQQHRLFDTTPDTVYGILVFCLAAAVVGLWIAYVMQTRSFVSKLIELNVSCVETLKVLSGNLERLRDSGVNMTDDLKAELGRTREHIALKIDALTPHLRYGKQTETHEEKAIGGAKGAPPTH